MPCTITRSVVASAIQNRSLHCTELLDTHKAPHGVHPRTAAAPLGLWRNAWQAASTVQFVRVVVKQQLHQLGVVQEACGAGIVLQQGTQWNQLLGNLVQ